LSVADEQRRLPNHGKIMHILIAALHRPTKPTGVCRHAANLAQCLAESDRVTRVTLVVGVWQKSYFETFFHSEKINLVSVDIKNSSSVRNIWFLFGLPKLANHFKPDIVHLSFPIPFLRSLFKSSVVTTIHDLYPYEFPENFGFPNSIFNRLFLKQCISNSQGLTCVSEITKKQLKFYFPGCDSRKAVNSIYNYVDFSQITPKIPQAIGSLTAEPFFLCVAQHRKNKNLDLVIHAYNLLRKEKQISDSTQLILVGSPGPETGNLERQINELFLQKYVHFLSSINDSELCWLYQNCQLLVIASSTEGFCLPLAEALTFSCKIVCSDIPILREIGSSDCTYFDLQKEPITNMAKAITLAKKQPLLIKNSNHDRFTKSTIGSQYLEFYSTII
jgi:glycosyltransferase involved in cell wall biosynthesis